MLNHQQLEQSVHQYISFLQIDDEQLMSEKLTRFFSQSDTTKSTKEAIMDRDTMMLFDKGKLIEQFKLEKQTDFDRLIKFDGTTITDVNPYAYLDNNQIKMKGDDDSKSRRSSKNNTTDRKGTNNNNNNNNNNNG